MGNVVGKRGRRRSIKVMTMEGQVVKIRPPATVAEVLNKWPGYVLLHSADVRQNGGRATPLPPSAELLPRNVYILMQAATLVLPQQRQHRLRTASDVSASMSAVERLDSLLLQRRCLSDIAAAAAGDGGGGGEGGSVRVKLRLSKAELAMLMARSSAGSSEDDSFSSSSCSSASHSGSLRPVKPALRGVSDRCKSPHSQGNRVRFQQQEVC